MDLSTPTPIPNSQTNLTKAAKILEQVLSLGVTDFCLCAGARNSPFITLMDENKKFFESKGHLFHFFDERAAGFFALGCAQRTQRPVAVITTSGTAVAELLPSAVEAYYSNTPLIFITADRPPTYRGTGAPQTIEQMGIFSHYTLPTLDLVESINPLLNLQWNHDIPLHLNVCFTEPLIDGPLSAISAECKHPHQTSPLKGAGAVSAPQTTSAFFAQCKQPLIIISGLAQNEASYVAQQLKDFSGCWWIETLSGLRGHPDLESRRLTSGYPYLASLMEKNIFDGIIRIGSIPTTRLWRDLEDKFKSLPVLSLSENTFTGLSRSSDQKSLFYLNTVCEHYRYLNNDSKHQEVLAETSQQDHIYSQEINSLLESHPYSQLNLVRRLSKQVGEQPLYLGNSLPIREWDFVAKPQLSQAVSGNRGANGIDGQLSTFLGWRSVNTHSWALLGDLTTLYDLNAPWIISQQSQAPWTLAIMNNSGGQIFKPMFGRDAFLNRHNISFNHWAQMWNLTYHRTESLTETFSTLPLILEIVPCEKQTQQLNLELDQLWKKL